MDPERPIEKLLRAFAKKRRDAAGPPFELPSHRRRQLLKEVERQREAAPDAGGFFRTVIPLPRLVFVLAVVSIVAILAAMLLPALSKAKSKAQRTTALAQKKQAELEQAMRQEELPVSAPVAATAPASPAMPNRSYDGFASHDLNITNAIAESAFLARSKAEGDTLTVYAGTTRSYSSTSVLMDDKELHLALAATNGLADQLNSPTVQAAGELKLAYSNTPVLFGDTVIASGGNISLATQTQRYRRLAVPNENDEKRAASKVLSTFSVEWNKANLTIRDADGSIYTGAVLAAASAFDAPAGGLGGNDASFRERLGPGSNYFFRVEGTNVGLKQPIVFAGKFVSNTNGPLLKTINGDAAGMPPLSSPPWMEPYDISGTITTEGGRSELYAAPAAP